MREIIKFDLGTDGVRDMNVHQDIEIIYVLKGKVDITIDDDTYQMNPGDYLLVNANKRHAVINTVKDVMCARFELDYTMMTEYLGTTQILFWCNTVVDRSEAYEELRHVMDRILNMYFEERPEERFRLRSLYYEMIYLLAANFMVNTSDSRMKIYEGEEGARISEIRSYIQSNYHREISLNDLADRLYLSNAYLSRYIKKQFGLSFMGYLNNIRLFHAMEDLLYTEKKLVHIAVDNGFSTSTAFNKAFKNCYGMTPSEYRVKMKKKDVDEVRRKELDEKEQQKVRQYLEEKAVSEKNAATDRGRVLCLDTEEWKNLERPWAKTINIGEAGILLRSDLQDHIAMIQKDLHFEYGRIWNIFELFLYNVGEEKRQQTNYSQLDRVLDFLLENNLKPFIELAFKPSQLIEKEEVILFSREKEILFQSKEEYEFIMKELAVHLVNRYGLVAVEQWKFELWKDPRMNIHRENGWYYDNFETTYCMLKNISEKIQVGGPGIVLGYENYLYKTIFDIWKKRKIKPDFLSVYSYGYVTVEKDNDFFAKKSLDSRYTRHQLEVMKAVMEEAGFAVPRIYVTEWSFTLSNRNVFNDSCGQGAYVMRNAIDAAGELDMLSYWHATDLFSEFYDTEAILNGDSGLLAKDGMRKPSFYAFQFLERLYPRFLGKDSHSIVTTDGRDSFMIACHNGKRLTYRYTVKPENEIEVSEQKELYADGNSLRQKICIRNVRPGKYLMKAYFVNQSSGSIQDIWMQMGHMEQISHKEIDYLNRVSVPHVEMALLEARNGTLEIETSMQANEIRMIEVNYQY